MTRAGALEVALLRRAGRRAEATARASRTGARRTRRARSCATRRCCSGRPIPRSGAISPATRSACSRSPSTTWRSGPGTTRSRCSTQPYPSGAGVVAEPGLPAAAGHPEVAYYRGYCRERLGQIRPRRLRRPPRACRRRTSFRSARRRCPCCARALEANPGDATAHASCWGRSASPAAGWRRASRSGRRRARLDSADAGAAPQPGPRPCIHARPARARARGADRRASTPTRERRGLPGARPGAGPPGPARRRSGSRALERHPGSRARCRPRSSSSSPWRSSRPGASTRRRRSSPAASSPARSSAQPAAGLPRGRLQRALALARAGRREEARRSPRTLGDAVPGLAFTADGMEAFVDGAARPVPPGRGLRARRRRGRGARSAGEAAAAAGDRYPHADAAFATWPRRRLGLRTRRGAARARWKRRSRRGTTGSSSGTNFPGANAAGQGYFLQRARARGGGAGEAARGAAAAGQDDVPLPEPRGPRRAPSAGRHPPLAEEDRCASRDGRAGSRWPRLLASPPRAALPAGPLPVTVEIGGQGASCATASTLDRRRLPAARATAAIPVLLHAHALRPRGDPETGLAAGVARLRGRAAGRRAAATTPRASSTRSATRPPTATTPWSGRPRCPYSNGKVGMFGGSYVGATQMLAADGEAAAPRRHPPLRHRVRVLRGLDVPGRRAHAVVRQLVGDRPGRGHAAAQGGRALATPEDWVEALPVESYRLLEPPPGGRAGPVLPRLAGTTRRADDYWRADAGQGPLRRDDGEGAPPGGLARHLLAAGRSRTTSACARGRPRRRRARASGCSSGPGRTRPTSPEGKVGDVVFGKAARARRRRRCC